MFSAEYSALKNSAFNVRCAERHLPQLNPIEILCYFINENYVKIEKIVRARQDFIKPKFGQFKIFNSQKLMA